MSSKETPDWEEPEPEEDEPSPFKIALGFFILPLLLVIGGIGIFLLFGVLAHEDVDPASYLAEINGRGINEPWQAAFHLSQQLQFNDELHGDEDFAGQVVAALESADDDDPRIQRFLAIALGRIGHPVAVPALVNQLGNEDDEVKVNTLWALGNIGDPAAADAVAGLLNSDQDDVRTMSAYVLGVLASPTTAERLQVSLTDPVPAVRWNSAVALGLMGDRAGTDMLGRMIDREHLAQTPGVLADDHATTMLAALAALEKLGPMGLDERLVLLRESDPDPRVRAAARRVLAVPQTPNSDELAN
ncbi:MAG: hypothetical protein GKS06_18360 [Acidobacteria bacterium]|nr:hypothetical protein [Acidobacteriota bacterium]